MALKKNSLHLCLRPRASTWFIKCICYLSAVKGGEGGKKTGEKKQSLFFVGCLFVCGDVGVFGVFLITN